MIPGGWKIVQNVSETVVKWAMQQPVSLLHYLTVEEEDSVSNIFLVSIPQHKFFLICYKEPGQSCTVQEIVNLKHNLLWRTLCNHGRLAIAWSRSILKRLIVADLFVGYAQAIPTPPLGTNLENVASTSIVRISDTHFKVVVIYFTSRACLRNRPIVGLTAAIYDSISESPIVGLTAAIYDSISESWEVKEEYSCTSDYPVKSLIICWPGRTVVSKDGLIYFLVHFYTRDGENGCSRGLQYSVRDNRWADIGKSIFGTRMDLIVHGNGVSSGVVWEEEGRLCPQLSPTFGRGQLLPLSTPRNWMLQQTPGEGKMLLRDNRRGHLHCFYSSQSHGYLQIIYTYDIALVKFCKAKKVRVLADLCTPQYFGVQCDGKLTSATYSRLLGDMLIFGIQCCRELASATYASKSADPRTLDHVNRSTMPPHHADWSMLPRDMLIMIAQKVCLRKNLISLAQVCKLWCSVLKLEIRTRREPVIAFLTHLAPPVLFLYHLNKGWSPNSRMYIPFNLKPYVLIHGPWVITYDSASLCVYNVYGGASSFWRTDKYIYKVGVLNSDGKQLKVLCIYDMYDHLLPETLEILEDTIDTSIGTQYPWTLKGRDPERNHNVIIVGQFVYSLVDNSILCYDWEADKWENVGEANTSFLSIFLLVEFYVQHPLVNVNGNLGIIHFSGLNGTVQLRISVFKQEQSLVMPYLVWSTFIELLDLVSSRSGVGTLVRITTLQCEPSYILMLCKHKSLFVAIIVYNVVQNSWDVIPLLQDKVKLGQCLYFSAECNGALLKSTAPAGPLPFMPIWLRPGFYKKS